jgi:hypothetical protein
MDVYDSFDKGGFIVGVFRGVRSFRIDPQGWLTGVVYRTRWSNDVNTAECRRTETYMPMYGSPVGGYVAAPPLPEGHGMAVCRHGFYAYGDQSNDYYQPGLVSGVIYGWGKEVMVGTRGFRCMRARIAALCITEVKLVDRERIELMQERYYNIPFFPTFKDMVAEFPPDWPRPQEEAA